MEWMMRRHKAHASQGLSRMVAAVVNGARSWDTESPLDWSLS